MRSAPEQSDTSFTARLRRVLTPPPLGPDAGLEIWRERILFFLLAPGLALGFIAYLSALPTLLLRGHYLVVIVDALMIALCLAIFLLRDLPWRLRAGLLLLVCYVVGAAVLLSMGPISGGMAWLFTMPLVGGVLMGVRTAQVCLGINCLALLGLSWIIYGKLLPWAGTTPHGMERWPIIAINYLLLNAVTAIPVAVLVRGLEKTMLRHRQISHELEQGRSYLTQEMAIRRRAQKALAESEKKYRLVAENASDAIWTLDLTTMRLSYISPSVEHILGFTPQEMYNRTLDQILAPASYALAMAVLREELDAEPRNADPVRSRRMELQHLRKDGTLIWAEVPVRFLRGEQGEPTALLGISRDITARKKAEEALRQSEKRYRDLFDSISDIIYTQDLEGRFTSVNPAAAELFGYSPDELIGRKGSEFMLPEYQPYFESEYLVTVREKGFMAGLGQYRDKGENRHYIEFRSTLVRPEKGEPYISGIGREVTDRVRAHRQVKQLQKQLLQSQKMEAVGTLAGGIAHDFNNTLAVMMGYTELALSATAPGDPRHEQLDQVFQAGERAAAMVKQLLNFSRRSYLNQSPMVLQSMVEDGLELLKTSLPQGVELSTDLRAPGEVILADPTQMHQVLASLVDNAFFAMRSGGGVFSVGLERITLGPQQAAAQMELAAGDYLRLTVSDTGTGMPPQVCERVFEPFFTTKQVNEGSGMGLAVAHGIVTSHGGAIQVESRPGEGAVFTVLLPCLRPDLREQAPAKTASGPAGGHERILVVDDEQQMRHMMKQLLQRLGYEVRAVSSSPEALETLADAPKGFDLIITDLTMPGIPGDELARRAAVINPSMPVIISTGHSGCLLDRDTPPNVSQVITKPTPAVDLDCAVRRALDLPGRRKK